MPTLSLDIAVERTVFSLQVRQQLTLDGITAVFGPSGSGKTTLLRAIAGLEPAAIGRVAFDGAIWQDGEHRMPPHARRVGYVFQDGRLFAHLTVERNLRFALARAARLAPAGGRPITFDSVIAALDLQPLLARRPTSLSGGEQQRVAIGRALVGNPQLLLMDEPLSSLDVRRKREIAPHIESLPRTFGVPVLYVTHNLDEVARLAADVLLIAGGRAAGQGTVTDVLQRVDLPSFADERQTGAVLHACVRSRQAGIAELDLGKQVLLVPLAEIRDGARLRVRVHASDVAIATVRPRHISIRNVLEASILRIDAGAGPYVEVLLAVDEQQLRSRITRDALQELELQVGQPVFALVKSVALEGSLLG
jgi:molybdate transport system ATP-binding protein